MVSEKNIGANQFEDVSLEPQFSSLIGFTEAEFQKILEKWYSIYDISFQYTIIQNLFFTSYKYAI